MIMLKKPRLLAICAVAALMACGLAYTEDSSLKDKKTISVSSQETNQEENIDINKISEAFGHFIGRNLHSPGINFDLESIIKGMRNGAAGNAAPMSDEQYEKMMAKLQERAFNATAETNLKSAEDFLNKNAKAEGVTEIIPNKLQYIILEKGNGPQIPEHGTPMINYTGKYIDGTVFGSSEEAGGPISVPLDQTIPGFSKGIADMKEGEKRRLYVHPELGYGKAGHLPPNSLLIFDIEVVKATSPEPEAPLAPENNGDSENDDEDLDEDFHHEANHSESKKVSK